MCLEYVYLIICFLAVSPHCYQLNKKLCEGSSCFYLYDSPNSYLTWDQSYAACIDEGLEMLRIESNQTQTVVHNLLQAVPQDTMRKVWVGGRRSTDNTWRFMNGTEFSNTVNLPTSVTGQYCPYVRLCKGINPEYHADSCDEKTSPSRLLCQYEPNKTSNCRSSDVLYGNKCYMKTKYNGNESNKIDWYTGQTYCSQSDIQGDIAYSYLDDDTLINNIIDLVHPGYNCTQLWLGVRTRIWFWKTASNTDEDLKAINYYKWDPRTNVDSSVGDCIYIDVDRGNNWLTGRCSDPPLRYFICMKSTIFKTTTTTTLSPSSSSTFPSTSRTTSTVTAPDKPTGNITENISSKITDCHSNYKSGFYALIAVSFILSAVVITLIVYCIWLRRKIFSINTQQPVFEVRDNVTSQQDNSQYSEYEITSEQPRQVNTIVSPEGIEMTTDNNQYERPTVYVNMVDRRNEYESLKG